MEPKYVLKNRSVGRPRTLILVTNDCTNFLRLVQSFALFPSNWMWYLCLELYCLCAIILVSSAMLRNINKVDTYLVFNLSNIFWKENTQQHERTTPAIRIPPSSPIQPPVGGFMVVVCVAWGRELRVSHRSVFDSKLIVAI